MRLGENSYFTTAQVALDATADILTFRPSIPCRIVRFGVVVSVLLDVDPAALVIDLDTNDILASPSRSAARLQLTTAVASGTFVVGSVLSRKLGEAAADSFEMYSGLGKNIIVPGNEAILQVSTAATAGDGYAFIEYTPLSWANMNNLPSGNVHVPTEFTS